MIHAGICDAMSPMVGGAGSGEAAVLVRPLKVPEALEIEAEPARRAVLRRHARLARMAGRLGIADEAGRNALGIGAAGVTQV